MPLDRAGFPHICSRLLYLKGSKTAVIAPLDQAALPYSPWPLLGSNLTVAGNKPVQHDRHMTIVDNGHYYKRWYQILITVL